MIAHPLTASAEVHTFSIRLSEAEWRSVDTGIPDAVEMLQDTRNVLHMLADEITAGNLDPDQPGLTSLLRLVGRAVESMETKEIAALGMLDTKLRRCASEQAEARRQAELKGRN